MPDSSTSSPNGVDTTNEKTNEIKDVQISDHNVTDETTASDDNPRNFSSSDNTEISPPTKEEKNEEADSTIEQKLKYYERENQRLVQENKDILDENQQQQVNIDYLIQESHQLRRVQKVKEHVERAALVNVKNHLEHLYDAMTEYTQQQQQRQQEAPQNIFGLFGWNNNNNNSKQEQAKELSTLMVLESTINALEFKLMDPIAREELRNAQRQSRKSWTGEMIGGEDTSRWSEGMSFLTQGSSLISPLPSPQVPTTRKHINGAPAVSQQLPSFSRNSSGSKAPPPPLISHRPRGSQSSNFVTIVEAHTEDESLASEQQPEGGEGQAEKRHSNLSFSSRPRWNEFHEEGERLSMTEAASQQSNFVKGAVERKRPSAWHQRVSSVLKSVVLPDVEVVEDSEDLNAMNRMDDHIAKSYRFSELTFDPEQLLPQQHQTPRKSQQLQARMSELSFAGRTSYGIEGDKS